MRRDNDEVPLTVILQTSGSFIPPSPFSWTFQSGDVITFQSGDTIALNS